MTDLERFHACMEYRPADRRPNHEIGVWAQTKTRWLQENPGEVAPLTWDWLEQENRLLLDKREYVPVNYDFMPQFEAKVLESTPEYEIIQSSKGIVSTALKEGTEAGMRMSMDQYLRFPVETPADFQAIKSRLIKAIPERYFDAVDANRMRWTHRDFVLILGRNCAANGFYWRARELMGTENLSLAWYDYPQMMHEMMEFYADFIIETSRPVLEKIQVDYFTLNEDMSMKSGPLLSPATFREFIFPHLRRMVDFFKSHGTKYFAVDTDGDPSALVPLLLDAGMDILWPMERAANANPMLFRQKFGKSLRLMGGVDKRVLIQGPAAIRAHLREMIPLIEEGGFIPTIDHTVPPDISWDHFRYYMECKWALLNGDFAQLED